MLIRRILNPLHWPAFLGLPGLEFCNIFAIAKGRLGDVQYRQMLGLPASVAPGDIAEADESQQLPAPGDE